MDFYYFVLWLFDLIGFFRVKNEKICIYSIAHLTEKVS